MAHVDLSVEIVARLSAAEFRLLDLALLCAAAGEPVKRDEDRAAMAALNRRLQELRLNRLREALAAAEKSLGRAAEVTIVENET